MPIGWLIKPYVTVSNKIHDLFTYVILPSTINEAWLQNLNQILQCKYLYAKLLLYKTSYN